MSKNVKSTDPRKPEIMAALKRKTGANKVTLVKENNDGSFSGSCLKGGRAGYQQLGTFTVTYDEVFPDTEVNL